MTFSTPLRALDDEAATTESSQQQQLAASATSIEARAEQATGAAADARIYERDASMWRVLYEASEQERLNLLGMIRGEQIP